uniref:Uncharacterized protein n=1 Tax=Anguilla anguilla TaxID=7936 RepID=A0A0E9UYB0_ANGAN
MTHFSAVRSATASGPSGAPGRSRTLTLKICFAKPPVLLAVKVNEPHLSVTSLY